MTQAPQTPPSPTLAGVQLTQQEVLDALGREHFALLVETVQLRALRDKLEQVIRDQEARLLALAGQVPDGQPADAAAAG